MGKLTRGGFPLKKEPAGFQCPYCLRPVGYLGRAAAHVFGTGIHGCDFLNVDIDAMRAALKESVG